MEEKNKIICPYPDCKKVNEPTDYEDCNIGYAPMKCEHCEREFSLSREITIEYDTWIDE